MSSDLEPVDLTVVDTNSAPWEDFPVPAIDAVLEHIPLYEDATTGMNVIKMVYRAGFTNTWHTHNCAHGFYILEGTLNTHRGTFGPGNFVWFPEGGIMQHGATADGDCTFLFITNKAFDIHHHPDFAPQS